MYYSQVDEKLDVKEMSSTKYHKYSIYLKQFAFRTTQKRFSLKACQENHDRVLIRQDLNRTIEITGQPLQLELLCIVKDFYIVIY